MLDPCPSLLRSFKPPIECRVDHFCVAQNDKGRLCLRYVRRGWWRFELDELDSSDREIGYEILHPTERALHSLDAVVPLHVVRRFKRLLKELQVEAVAEPVNTALCRALY